MIKTAREPITCESGSPPKWVVFVFYFIWQILCFHEGSVCGWTPPNDSHWNSDLRLHNFNIHQRVAFLLICLKWRCCWQVFFSNNADKIGLGMSLVAISGAPLCQFETIVKKKLMLSSLLSWWTNCKVKMSSTIAITVFCPLSLSNLLYNSINRHDMKASYTCLILLC